MSPDDYIGILAELTKMIPNIEDIGYDEQYRHCYNIYNALDDWRNYTLEEYVDAITFTKHWYWRKKL